MKIFLSMCVVILMVVGLAFGEEPKERKEQSICPKTKMSESCLECHVKPDFRLREIKPDAHMDYPNGLRIIDGKGYFNIYSIDTSLADSIADYFLYLNRHKVKHIVIDIYSPGGNLFAAWKIKGLFNEFQEEGGIVETRLRGFAASAGSILFCAGNKGHRIGSPQAEMMFHELWGFKFLAIETPSDKEDEAKIYRHLQDTISDWLVTRGNITKAEMDSKIRKKEFWINGKEAFELGFIDKLVIGK